MTFNASQAATFRKLLGLGLLALALLGATSLCTKEIPLAIFGERSIGTVKKVEIIATSTESKWERKGFGPKQAVSRGGDSTFMDIGFTTKDGKLLEVKTLATFHTEAKVGDTHPMIYLPSKPGTAKIYSAKQLWLPMCVGTVFTVVCLFLGMRIVRRKSTSAASGRLR
jgi:hypothetical protein